MGNESTNESTFERPNSVNAYAFVVGKKDDDGYKVTCIRDSDEHTMTRDLSTFMNAEDNWATDSNKKWSRKTKDRVRKVLATIEGTPEHAARVAAEKAAKEAAEKAAKEAAEKAVTLVKEADAPVKGRRRLGWKPSHDIPRRREGFHHLFNPSIQESIRCQES